ncbi:hypothetical protein EV702DRAFT_1250011 [Suillus placidus]|uniref:Uncharacterized protein n=1 Tax=Suillus placidus TaxID=48579 RepID=A0A9P6ZL88_9AGAM|nr:hypothetical protein EV702DRAFT_1250011 [Suillus placidus]
MVETQFSNLVSPQLQCQGGVGSASSSSATVKTVVNSSWSLRFSPSAPLKSHSQLPRSPRPVDKASRILGIAHRKSMEPIPASTRTSVVSTRSAPSTPTQHAPTLPLTSLYVVSGLPKSPHTWTLADPDAVLGLSHSEGAVACWWRPEVLGSTVSPGAGATYSFNPFNACRKCITYKFSFFQWPISSPRRSSAEDIGVMSHGQFLLISLEKCDYTLVHFLVALPFEIFTPSAVAVGIENVDGDSIRNMTSLSSPAPHQSASKDVP